jgi:hypothetical protein
MGANPWQGHVCALQSHGEIWCTGLCVRACVGFGCKPFRMAVPGGGVNGESDRSRCIESFRNG